MKAFCVNSCCYMHNWRNFNAISTSRKNKNEHTNEQTDRRPYERKHPAGDVLWVFVEPGNVVP